mgnify:CR=1 FL=1
MATTAGAKKGLWSTIRRIAASDRISGLIMLGFALTGLVLANLPATAHAFETVAETHLFIPYTNLDLPIGHWAQDGLLTIFFLTVGLELKQELTTGSLANPKAAAVPMLCAVGGMIAPPILFLAVTALFSQLGPGEPGTLILTTTGSSIPFSEMSHGWAVPTATDIAFSLAVLALFAMAEASGHEPDVALNIEKRIPVGAGMAGGSADAAATILALNTLWNLDWSIERLQQVAATLGADMPFCLTGGYARGTGFGEQIEQLSENSDAVLELTDQGFAGRLLVGAYQAELRTPEVYAMFDQIGAGATDNNHLQQASISLHPRSGQAIDEALQAGAKQAFVSGSGPSVIAFVPTDDAARAVQSAWQQSRCVDRIIATKAPAHPIVHIIA